MVAHHKGYREKLEEAQEGEQCCKVIEDRHKVSKELTGCSRAVDLTKTSHTSEPPDWLTAQPLR